MAFARSSIQTFALANPKYILATVTFYTVDVNGNATAVLAPLYAGVIGTAQVPNPQLLDSRGKFKVPVYIDAPVIGIVTSMTVAPAATGIISSYGRNRGAYTAATLYYENDIVQDPATGIIYNVVTTFISTNLGADITAGNLVVFLTPTALTANQIIATSSTSQAIGTGSKTFAIQTGKSFTVGAWVTITSSGSTSSWMFGQVTSYNSGTGTLVVNVSVDNGSGTHTDWDIELSGVRGAQGDTGLTGVGMPIASAGGTSDVITAAFTPPITSLTDKLLVAVIAAAANTTTTPTLQLDSTAAHTITKRGGAALAVGDIVGAGALYFFEYNLASTRFELANPGTIAEVNISFTDNTTNNVSTSKHGYAPKAPNDVTKFLNGLGAYSVPAGGSVNSQGFGSSGTWTKPATGTLVYVRLWGAGGSGGGGDGGGAIAGGGGGGAYREFWALFGFFSATYSVTIGAGGASVSNSNGNTGGTSSFGGILAAYGGAGGLNGGNGGGGAGLYQSGSSSTGGLVGGGAGDTSGGGPGGYATDMWGGGGGGGGNGGGSGGAGGTAGNGGGGGGGGNFGGSPGAGGISQTSGSGGAGTQNGNATAGSTPSGGGGGNFTAGVSGAGGDGRCEVYVF